MSRRIAIPLLASMVCLACSCARTQERAPRLLPPPAGEEGGTEFTRRQNLSSDEPFSTVLLRRNTWGISIGKIDGVSTRYDNPDHWSHLYYPEMVKVRPGKHLIEVAVNGHIVKAWDETVNLDPGMCYEFILDMTDTSLEKTPAGMRRERVRPVLQEGRPIEGALGTGE